MLEKKCWRCKQYKSLSDFSEDKNTLDGKQTKCIPCQKTLGHEWYLKNKTLTYSRTQERRYKNRTNNRQRISDIINKMGGCQICHELEPCTIDFHHIEPKEKEFNISRKIQDFQWDRLKTEIAKCVMLCANCHRRVHYLNLDISHLKKCILD